LRINSPRGGDVLSDLVDQEQNVLVPTPTADQLDHLARLLAHVDR
jgi:hypothetical protein